MEKTNQQIREKIIKYIEKKSGFSKEFIDSHTMWELEEILGIGHYKIQPVYTYMTLRCGCRIKIPVKYRSGHF